MGKFRDLLAGFGLEPGEEADYNGMDAESDAYDDPEMDAEEAPRPQRNARPQQEAAQSYRKSGNIETIKPATYGDAHKIIEKLRDGNIIVFSLELVDDDLALRILDFVYGGTFALSGKIKEVGTRVYVVTNYGVNLSEIAGSNDSQRAPSYR